MKRKLPARTGSHNEPGEVLATYPWPFGLYYGRGRSPDDWGEVLHLADHPDQGNQMEKVHALCQSITAKDPLVQGEWGPVEFTSHADYPVCVKCRRVAEGLVEVPLLPQTSREDL